MARQSFDLTPGQPLTIAEKVVRERARRIALGFDYDFGDERGVHRIGTTEADMRGWDKVTKLSSALIALGQGSTEITIWPGATAVAVTALEWQQILVAAGVFEQPIWQASFTLQAMDPIPDDLTDDSYWEGA